MQSLLAKATMIYQKTVMDGKNYSKFKILDSDFLSIFTQNYSADTYIGTPFTKIHDFEINALKAVAFENHMPHVTDCVNAIELFELEVKLGMQQMFLEKTFNKKMAGPITIKDAFSNIPNIFGTCMMSKFD